MNQEAGFTSVNLQVLLLEEKRSLLGEKKAITKASTNADKNQIKRQHQTEYLVK